MNIFYLNNLCIMSFPKNLSEADIICGKDTFYPYRNSPYGLCKKKEKKRTKIIKNLNYSQIQPITNYSLLPLP